MVADSVTSRSLPAWSHWWLYAASFLSSKDSLQRNLARGVRSIRSLPAFLASHMRQQQFYLHWQPFLALTYTAFHYTVLSATHTEYYVIIDFYFTETLDKIKFFRI